MKALRHDVGKLAFLPQKNGVKLRRHFAH